MRPVCAVSVSPEKLLAWFVEVVAVWLFWAACELAALELATACEDAWDDATEADLAAALEEARAATMTALELSLADDAADSELALTAATDSE